jgi:hypothetical protein
MRLPGKPIEGLMGRGVENLIRLACVSALVGLAVMMVSIVYPAPLLVIFAMSGGQVIGVFAVLCYALAIVLDQKQRG